MRIILLFVLFIPWFVLEASVCLKPIKQRQVITFGSGIHELRNLCSINRNVVIEGKGPGVTILKIQGGIHLSGANPIIRNITIIGNGKGIGIHLENTWSAILENIRIQNFSTGILIELTRKGRVMARGKTMRGWPYDTNDKTHWGSRVTLTEIRNAKIYGPGYGIVMRNRQKHTHSFNYWKPTDDGRPGEFMNSTTIWGGHIAVRKTAIIIGDGVYATKIFGTYIDVSEYGGIYMERGSRGLWLLGVTLDPNSYARKKKAFVLQYPKRGKRFIRINYKIRKDLIQEY